MTLVTAIEPTWQANVVDELTRDEWPVDDDTMDQDELVYEMEALEAERLEEQLLSSNNDNLADLEEEEDDVDQDDIEEEEEEDDDGMVYDVQQQEEETIQSDPFDDDQVMVSPPPTYDNHVKATTTLQQQEELDLEDLDQSIVDTLQAALDIVKQDRPRRFIPISINNDTILTTTKTTTTSSSFFVSLLHYLISWTSYSGLGILLTLVILLLLKRYKQRSIRDHHQLPSYSVYKQKSSVD
ncbi:hypothetical protein BC941DRAFT_515156 [Chlamydoabsidia padenii]|nr:hypothetical protein BC941DRAFT_515156 [Chlamydoabsidia padenii]